jgi:adenylate cyclase
VAPVSDPPRAVSDAQFAQAGLLDGLDAAAAQIRCRALRALVEDGLSLEELRAAVREQRLALLVLEHSLSRSGQFTLAQVAQRAGLALADVAMWFRALGRAMPVSDDPVYTDDDVRLAVRLREYEELGFERGEVFDVARLWGRNTARIADASAAIMEKGLFTARNDPDLALRLALQVQKMAETEARLTAHVLALNLAQRLGSTAVSTVNSAHARMVGEQTIAVCFADIVGFTAMGEQLSAQALGDVAAQLAAIATEAVDPPVRVFKAIGDAVMLLSTEVESLVGAALSLVAAAREQGLPPLRASVAYGLAVARSGDVFGRPVNLASRIIGVAPPHSVVVTDTVQAMLPGDRFVCEPAGEHPFKGVEGATRLFTVRWA